MSTENNKRYLLSVQGGLACFTGPCKVERDSYPLITPSAARSLFDAICWKPAMRWMIHRIFVLNKVRYTTFRRNELKQRANQFGEAPRDLKLTRALRDVSYIIEGSFHLTKWAGEGDNWGKFDGMFNRRLDKGQSHYEPYLGCREFPARIERFNGSLADAFAAANKNVEIQVWGMVWDYASATEKNFLTFDAEVREGVLEVPTLAELRKRRGSNDN